MLEHTLLVIKPDGVERKLVGKILSRFEEKDFKIIQLKMFHFEKEQAEEFYLPHCDQLFFF